MPSFQKLILDLKDKNYKKAKMKKEGYAGWKNIGNDPRSLFNGNNFSSLIEHTKETL